MLDTTINELMRARDLACLGAPLASLNLDPIMACWLKYKLSVCIDDPSVWTDPSTSPTAKKKTVTEIIRRLMRSRDELATNQISYVCKTSCSRPGGVAFVAVHLTHCAGGIEDERVAVTIGSPTCVAQFVAATNGKPLDPFDAFSCGVTARCGTVPADLPENCGGEFGPPPLPPAE